MPNEENNVVITQYWKKKTVPRRDILQVKFGNDALKRKKNPKGIKEIRRHAEDKKINK